jgi:nucleoside-diphosphate-sugar epimerase
VNPLRTLFIGGTGIISSACVSEALAAGHDVTVLNRGTTSHRPIADGVKVITADVRDPDSLETALVAGTFDVVADFLSFTPDHVQPHIDRWTDNVGQYIFISSASAYQTPPARLPVVESTPLSNPAWRYSRNKIACEDRLVGAYRRTGFPMTIVRPSHTYDRTSLPFHGGWTNIERMRRGKPVIVHGDGTSLWVLTHHRDFARAFVGLFGDVRNHGDAFHITSDEVLTWDQIARALATAAGVDADIVHISSDAIAAAGGDAEWGDSLLGDKAHSLFFDNSKIKAAVPGWRAEIPYWRGAGEIIAWHDADPARRVFDDDIDTAMDTLIAHCRESVQPPVSLDVRTSPHTTRTDTLSRHHD